jgi:antitoxin MazE
MLAMGTTVQKWGNSLGIRVPKAIAEQVKLRQGTEIEFDTSSGVLTIRPRRRRYTLKQLLAQSKGCDPHGEWQSDAPRGREVI